MNKSIQTNMGAIEWSLLIILSMAWGATLFFTEIALNDFPPLSLAFLRVSFAAGALVLFALALGHDFRRDLPAWRALFIMGLLNNALPFSLIMWGQVEITGSLAAILNATTPLFTIIVAHIFTRDEKLNIHKITGIGFGILGVIVMIGFEALQSLGINILAQLAVLVAGLSYALAAVYGRRFQGISPVMTASGQLMASSLLRAPFALFFDKPWGLPSPQMGSWAALIAMALISTAGAYIIYFRLLASSGATNILLVTFLLPVSAIFLGFTFLGERLEPQHIAGMVLIALGLAAIDGRPMRWLKQRL